MKFRVKFTDREERFIPIEIDDTVSLRWKGVK